MKLEYKSVTVKDNKIHVEISVELDPCVEEFLEFEKRHALLQSRDPYKIYNPLFLDVIRTAQTLLVEKYIEQKGDELTKAIDSSALVKAASERIIKRMVCGDE